MLSSPIQGHMSDLTSRRRVILLTLSAVIVSLLFVLVGPRVFSVKLPVILGIAAVVNGVVWKCFPSLWSCACRKNRGAGKEFSLIRFCVGIWGWVVGFFFPFHKLVSFYFALSLLLLRFCGFSGMLKMGRLH